MEEAEKEVLIAVAWINFISHVLESGVDFKAVGCARRRKIYHAYLGSGS